MRITETTKYKDVEQVAQFFDEGTNKELKEAAEKKYGAMYDLPFVEFYACANGDFERLGDTSEPTVLQVYWLKRFEEFIEEFVGAINNLTVRPTPEEEQASEGIPKSNWAESILIFTRGYFGLHNFKEAERITIGEILIAKKAAYIEAMYRRRLQRIQMQKYNRK